MCIGHNFLLTVVNPALLSKALDGCQNECDEKQEDDDGRTVTAIHIHETVAIEEVDEGLRAEERRIIAVNHHLYQV